MVSVLWRLVWFGWLWDGVRAIALGRFVCCQAEDGRRYLVRSRGLGDVYKRQGVGVAVALGEALDLGVTKPGDCAEAQADRVAFILSLIHI